MAILDNIRKNTRYTPFIYFCLSTSRKYGLNLRLRKGLILDSGQAAGPMTMEDLETNLWYWAQYEKNVNNFPNWKVYFKKRVKKEKKKEKTEWRHQKNPEGGGLKRFTCPPGSTQSKKQKVFLVNIETHRGIRQKMN